MKNQKGITLIALVVTVIILIILAAIAINLLIGNNGIIKRTQEGTANWTKAEQNEISGLLGLESEIEELFQVPPPIPDGFEHKEGTTDKGYVIQHETEESEFVWIPVPMAFLDVSDTSDNTTIENRIKDEMNQGNYPMALKMQDGHYKGIVYKITADAGDEQVTVTLGADTLNYSVEPYVGDIAWYDKDTNMLAIAGFSLSDINTMRTQFLDQMQSDFDAMVTSVNEKGGFYLGRYETSIREQDSVIITQSKPGVTSMTGAIASGNRWYGMYEKQRRYASDNNIENAFGGMIWGSQLYQVLLWMRDVENPNTETWGTPLSKFFVANAHGMGWFMEDRDSNPDRLTGFALNESATNKVKNVWDLAGNKAEFCMAGVRYAYGNTTSQYGYSMPFYFGTVSDPSAYNSNMGSRMYLCFD